LGAQDVRELVLRRLHGQPAIRPEPRGAYMTRDPFKYIEMAYRERIAIAADFDMKGNPCSPAQKQSRFTISFDINNDPDLQLRLPRCLSWPVLWFWLRRSAVRRSAGHDE
jgi:hypothetical protein